ncbi:MAG: sulfite exporter TauE/SafE family protein [Bacteroidetes bacterium]|nr:sulfite exporter TauE/SafE family protein [Bacteroidota bacterium]
MSITEGMVIFIVGIAAGFANTVAGGGSLLSLPVLIFMDLPSSVANATNRVAIIMQNIFAVSGFKSKGVSTFPYSLYLGLSALVGAIIGARIAVDISSDLFNQILSIVMLLVVIMTIFNPFRKTQQIEEIMTFNRKALALVVFFFIGIYGGFIQAGVGFLMIAALTSINGFSLVKTNSAKVFVALIYTSAAIIVFIIEDQINWEYGIVLAMGNSLGGWIGSRWSVNKGDKWIKRFLVVTVVALAVKLWFFN